MEIRYDVDKALRRHRNEKAGDDWPKQEYKTAVLSSLEAAFRLW